MANVEKRLPIFRPPHFGQRGFRLDALAVRARKLKTRLQSSHRNSYTGIDQHSFLNPHASATQLNYLTMPPLPPLATTWPEIHV
jgi:hypothetical protein